jgi:hypothetical protein
LTNVSTSCTNDSATFRCYPFSPYSPLSPDTAAATFDWIITPVTSYSYTISSSDNPFAPQFANITLAMRDLNRYTERFDFNFTMAKPVVPSTVLPGTPASDGQGGGVTTCWFNETVMSATIWTRMRADYPKNLTTVPDPRNASNTFAPWPYRVEVRQVQQAGPGVPNCRDSNGRPFGNFAVAGDGGDCGCYYANFDLANMTSVGRRSKRIG